MAKKRETKINTLKAFFLGNIRLWFLRLASPCMNLEIVGQTVSRPVPIVPLLVDSFSGFVLIRLSRDSTYSSFELSSQRLGD